MQTDTYVNLTSDVLFKFVFSHEEIIKDLLESIFEYVGIQKKIKIVEVFKDYPIYGNNIEDKIFYGDIVAILDTGEYVSIEMYKEFGREEYLKSASYLSRLFGNQLKKGNTYINAKKVYSINFICGNYSGENKEVVNDYGFIRKIDNPNLDNEFINMLLIRLDLIKKMVYNINEKRIVKWGKYMMSNNMKEMEKIGKGDCTMEKSIKYIKEFLQENGTTWQDRLTYEKNKGIDKGRAEGIAEGRAEGKAEGIAEGKKENAIAIAKNMLKKNYSVSEIMDISGLSKREVEALI